MKLIDCRPGDSGWLKALKLYSAVQFQEWALNSEVQHFYHKVTSAKEIRWVFDDNSKMIFVKSS